MKYFSQFVVVLSWKVTGFHLALVFTASLSEVENGVKPCPICKTFWSIQTKLICCIEDFNVFTLTRLCFVKEINPGVMQDLLEMDLELHLPAWILILSNGKQLSLKGTRKISVQPGTNWLSVMQLYGFPSTDFSGFCIKKVSTWLTILLAPWFQVQLEFFSPSSTLIKLDVNSWFISK